MFSWLGALIGATNKKETQSKAEIATGTKAKNTTKAAGKKGVPGKIEIPDNYFGKLAYRAGFGDIHAMFLLGEWFRGKLSDTYLKLEAEWEKSPKEMHEKFLAYIKENKEEATNARIGVTWFMRAAAYGNEQAAELVAEHEHWDIISFFPELFFYPGSGLLVNISGEDLRTAGFFEFTEDDTYSIRSIDSNGVFSAETYAGYEGPDSDGYGMEEEYNFYRFDEFFHNIGSLQGYSNLDYRNNEKRFAEKWMEQQKVQKQQRESYWTDSQLPEDSERYKHLASTHSGAIIRNGVLKRYNDDGKLSYTVPETVTEIAAKAFKGNSSLQEIIVPETVKRIEAQAFSCCKALKKLQLPDHLTLLGDTPCSDSRELEEIHLPEKLIELPINMFEFNEALKQVKLPENLKKLQKRCFTYSDIQDISLPEGLEEIGESAFNNSPISKIQIPGNVKQIGKEAFYWCKELKEAIISEGVTETGIEMFEGCEKLESVKLPASLKKIASGTFKNCKSLKEIMIPASVEEIRSNAFDNCNSLQKVTIPASTNKIGSWAFEYCQSLKEITLPASIQEISYATFRNCTSLERITIPASVRKIDTEAFSGCTNLREITIPASIQEIGHDAFPEKIIIHGKPGTEAERYARENKCKFRKIK